MFDIIWGGEWPGVQARGLRNKLTARWVGREDELRAHAVEVQAIEQQAEEAGDPAESILLAGMGVGRIHELKPAGRVVQDIVAEAVAILHEWSMRVDGDR
jgi:nitronate monooxygenase